MIASSTVNSVPFSEIWKAESGQSSQSIWSRVANSSVGAGPTIEST